MPQHWPGIVLTNDGPCLILRGDHILIQAGDTMTMREQANEARSMKVFPEAEWHHYALTVELLLRALSDHDYAEVRRYTAALEAMHANMKH